MTEAKRIQVRGMVAAEVTLMSRMSLLWTRANPKRRIVVAPSYFPLETWHHSHVLKFLMTRLDTTLIGSLARPEFAALVTVVVCDVLT